MSLAVAMLIEEEYAALAPIMTENLESYIIRHHENYGPLAVSNFLQHRVFSTYTGSVVLKETISSPWFVHVHQIRLPSQEYLSLYDAEVMLLFNGENILEGKLITPPVPVNIAAIDAASRANSSEGPIDIVVPKGVLNSNLDLANLPETSRVVIRLLGSKNSNPSVLLTAATVNLFNYLNELNYSNIINRKMIYRLHLAVRMVAVAIRCHCLW